MVNVKEIEAVIPLQCEAAGFRIRRVITKKREDSDKLMLGICTIDPGCKGYNWSFNTNDEVYYILKGKIDLHFNGKKVVAKEENVVYLPAGWRYTLDNTGEEQAVIVYVLTPSIE